MSKLDDLIKEKCPNGVKYEYVGSIADVGTGSSNGNEAIDNGEYPFFVRSQTVKAKNDYEYDEEAIIIPGEGGIGDIYHYVNGKYALHQRVYRIHFKDDRINTRFMYYCFSAFFKRFILKKAVSATVTSIRKPMIEKFEVPVPPLEVQNEIVQILDNFAELTAELTAELSNRKKQYEYYRDLLLDFGENEQRERVKWFTISDIVTTKNARVKIMRNNYLTTGAYPIIDQSQKYIAGYTNDGGAVLPNDKYVIFGDHTTCLKYFEGEFVQGADGIKILIAKDFVVPKYLYYVMGSYKNFSVSYTRHWSKMASTKVPIPPLKEQERIVRVLDQFDKLATDIAEGLPAEIEAREKQYAYYRDKLLSFKELASNA